MRLQIQKKFMKNNLVNLFLICICFASAEAYSQDKENKVLSKEEAIAQMLEANFGIQLANNQVEIAENNASLLNSNYLPSVTGNAGATIENSDSETDFKGAQRDDGTVRQNIEILDAETKRYNASIDLNYTLFDGLGRLYNYKELKERYNLSQLQARETIENTMIQLFSVYYEVARLAENITNFKEALKISKRRELRAQYQFDYGQVNKLQVLNARVDITTDSINLLNEIQSYKNAQRDLNVVLNRDLKDLVSADTTVTFLNQMVLESYIEKSATANVNLLQAESDQTISEYQIKAAKSLLLPTVGLTGSYGWNRSENPASAFFPSTTRTEDLLSIGANLRWNIFDGGRAITALKNAKIVNSNQELLKKQLVLEINRDIVNAKGDYENALQIYQLQTQNVQTNQNNFKRSEERLKLGQITSVEFRQAQLNLLNAKTIQNRAKYNAKLAELRLLQLTGQLLNVEF